MCIHYIKRKNGCCVKYRESPITLPNDEVVLFKIEGFEQPDGVSNEEFEDFLKYAENKIDTEIIERTQAQGVFPHFYISCPYPDKADVLIKLFNMSYVEECNIMLFPACYELRFSGKWEEYKNRKIALSQKVLVVNAEDTEDEGSMIQYWIDNTHYEFNVSKYLCPATGALLTKEDLDGAHVEIVGYPEMGQFITPLQKGFNRSHSRRPFFVDPRWLVEAPIKG